MSTLRQFVQRLHLTRPRLALRRQSLRNSTSMYRITDHGRVEFGQRSPYRRIAAWLAVLAAVVGGALAVAHL